MPTAANKIAQRAADILQDTAGIRWSAKELIRWLNDGQLEAVLKNPDTTATYATGTLAAGTRQSLSSISELVSLRPYSLLEVIRNTAASSTKAAVRQTTRDVLDAQNPNWHNDTPSVNIIHFIYDGRVPDSFYVYPASTGAAQVEMLISVYPTDIAAPAGDDFSTVTGNISLIDIYANSLIDYILYRAFSKNTDFSGDSAKADMYYNKFLTAIGSVNQGTASTAPSVAAGTNVMSQQA